MPDDSKDDDKFKTTVGRLLKTPPDPHKPKGDQKPDSKSGPIKKGKPAK